MRDGNTDRLVVLAVSFAFFIGGVLAIGMERGTLRTVLLAGCFAALLAIAVRQTLRRVRKKRK